MEFLGLVFFLAIVIGGMWSIYAAAHEPEPDLRTFEREIGERVGRPRATPLPGQPSRSDDAGWRDQVSRGT